MHAESIYICRLPDNKNLAQNLAHAQKDQKHDYKHRIGDTSLTQTTIRTKTKTDTCSPKYRNSLFKISGAGPTTQEPRKKRGKFRKLIAKKKK